MSIGCAVLMCHAPIVVPPIAGERAGACAPTTKAMADLARTVLAHGPELIVLVSPHAPRSGAQWGIAQGERLTGSFARFGHPELRYEFQGAPDAARALADEAHARGLSTRAIDARGLDHGALVPLHFVREAGYRGPVLLVALPFPGTASEARFGNAIAAASRRVGARWAVLASGDMSHRLTRDAPAGFDPLARDFDARFVAHLRRGEVGAAVALDASLVQRAAEDVVQSTEVALGAVGEPRGTRVLSYEGPFGVGYCEALLHSDKSPSEVTDPPEELASEARAAIAAALSHSDYEPRVLGAPWDASRPVFVTLRGPGGELRGCIGRLEPVHGSLVEEIADCAVSAATRDYRVPSVNLAELGGLSIEVSVLEPPEPVDGLDDLDPARFGVVVSHGRQRGVLLPAVEGIDSAEEQVAVALRKGGISPGEPYRLERFLVHKVKLAPRADA